MKKILVIGAGRTANSLIKYLLDNSNEQDWFVTIADQSLELAQQKAGSHSRAKAIKFDVKDAEERSLQIGKADVIASLLPEHLHILLAKDCIKYRVNLVTASYISNEMEKLDEEVKDAGLVFLNEMGLDPGLDHMDAMNLLNKIKHKGGKLTSLRSFGGGLVSPESDTNPWGYKITWNPMNVVKAGMASARYVKDGKLRIVPYNRLFLDTQSVNVSGVSKLKAYPNRDSIKYRRIYKVPSIPNVFRGSLRKPGFCKAWNALVRIGLTDNRYIVPDSHRLTYNEWLSFYLDKKTGTDTKEALIKFLGEKPESEIIRKIEWLGLLSEKKIKLKDVTPAEILLDLLLEKWEFKKDDKDMVILQTEVIYELNSHLEKITSSLVLYGEKNFNTAMSTSVGYPMAVGVNLILNNKISERGVIIPIFPDIYKPALKELAELGIKFEEKTEVLK